MRYARLALAALLALNCAIAAEPFFLRRSASAVEPQACDLTTGAKLAAYKPLLGAGDSDAARLKTIARYGELTLAAGGFTATVSYSDEEQIYYVLDGTATLIYGAEMIAVNKDDFMYLPAGVKHGLVNSSAAPARVMVMGHRVPAERNVAPPEKPQIASANEVKLQVLASHGPTTQFKLLLGDTRSTRDRLACSIRVTSLFIMDFAPGGTNIPHAHASEEEIYYVLRGSGDMVAGTGAEGKDARHPARQGDVFFFAPGTRVGFYSGAKEGGEHDLILAVRSRL